MPSKPTVVPTLMLAALLAMPFAQSRAAAPVHALADDATQAMLAPMDTAHTFAHVRKGNVVSTVFVVALSRGSVTAIDLSELSGLHSVDAFDVISRFSLAQLDALGRQPSRTQTYPLSQLLGVGPP